MDRIKSAITGIGIGIIFALISLSVMSLFYTITFLELPSIDWRFVRGMTASLGIGFGLIGLGGGIKNH